MKKFIILLLLALSTIPAVFSGDAFQAMTAEDRETAHLDGKTLVVLDKNWKYNKLDQKDFSAVSFDDSSWKNVAINTPLTKSDLSKICWYRVKFDLADTPEKGFYELSLGYISAGDQVFINGVKCGEYAFRQTINASSDYFRRYRFFNDGSILKKGSNTIAVRVKNGYKSGMYDGIPKLRKLSDCQIIGKLASRSRGLGAAHRHISGNNAINNFFTADRLFVAPQLSLFGTAKKLTGVLTITVKQNSKDLEVIRYDLTVVPDKWLLPTPCEIKNPGAGSYQIVCAFTAGNQTIWQQQNQFTVREKSPLPIKVDASLVTLTKQPLPLEVGSQSFGNLGPRDLDSKNQLFDNFDTPDARSGIGNIFGISKLYKGVVLLHSQIKQNKAVKSADYIDLVGFQYDGLLNGWSSGWIRPASSDKIANMRTLANSWTSKKVRLEYADRSDLEVKISQLSPACQLKSSSNELIFFENYPELGAPRKLFSEVNGKFTELKSPVKTFEKNYLVVSFRGAAGWNEFDIPYLLVFEKRPAAAELLNNGVKISWNKSGGIVQVMPLYGVTLQGCDRFKSDILQRCRFWSKALLAMPENVSRTAKIDYVNNRMICRDTFTRRIIKDDWNTEPLKYSPIPPTLILAGSNTLDIALSHPAEDLDYAGLNGPFYAVKDSDSYVFVLNNVVNLVTEVRQTSNLKNTPQVKEMQKALLKLVTQKLLPEIRKHPWQRIVNNKARKAYSPGSLEPTITDLLLAAPFMPENVQKRIYSEILLEAPNFLNSELEAVERNRQGESKKIKINTTVYNPYSKQYLTTSTRRSRDSGIDGPCWESLRMYMVWSTAYHCNDYGFVKKGISELEKSYNMVVNSHDWAYSVCWDSFAGARIGNGLQESTIFHAGFAAYARIMNQLQRFEERDQAVYYSLIQLLGISACTSPAMIEFARSSRQVLVDNQFASDVDYLDKYFPDRYCEINERAGFYSWVIHPRMPYYNRFIMTHLPEVLRHFKVCFSSFTNRYFAGKVDGRIVNYQSPPMLDLFCYTVTEVPFPVEELMTILLQKRLDPWKQLANYRTYLEYNSNISYKKLWNK